MIFFVIAVVILILRYQSIKQYYENNMTASVGTFIGYISAIVALVLPAYKTVTSAMNETKSSRGDVLYSDAQNIRDQTGFMNHV